MGSTEFRYAPTEFYLLQKQRLHNDFMIYPNPSNQEVNIQFKSKEKEMKIEIIDAKGSLILSKKVNSSDDVYHEKFN
jgi:hypothetical protein